MSRFVNCSLSVAPLRPSERPYQKSQGISIIFESLARYTEKTQSEEMRFEKGST